MTLSPLETTAIAILLLLAGYASRRWIVIFDRLNLPAPVLGGLIGALAVLAVKAAGLPPVKFDTVLQTPMMIAFFTCLGFAASFRLLKKGGPQVVLLLVLASVVAVMQGLLGAGVAVAFGLEPLLGVLTGTVTLSGGPATGLAFAPQFEAAGVSGAATIATATAMAGILLASMVSSPLATLLIRRRNLDPRTGNSPEILNAEPDEAEVGGQAKADPTFTILKTIAVVVVSMWLGSRVSAAIEGAGVTLPAYVGAMLVAAAIRNIDDATGWLRLPMPAIQEAGNVTLALFLVMAIMGLDLTVLSGLAAPLMVNLVAQTLMMTALVLGPIWWLMGRDYDAAVTSAGFCGFMLGTTANAMAAMGALVEKYAKAPRAFLTVPLVGPFLLDFTNAIIITTFLNVWR